ncbi:MAG TPA: pseudouridine-5'-phosphate glycosidase, partial [Aggregatilineales bacterium]|nr:pseudouridine-5'-phosphate glycosidase [Aggregatilineales bacterium]
QMEAAIREAGAVPATVGLFHGQIVVGCNDDQLRTLAYAENIRKVSRRDFPIAIARRELGATTVAGTMIAAYLAGIQVFATGGIGGVHRGDADDVSADLPELAMTSVAVVCAGAKAILDLPRTLEYLETAGVPVLGYGTDTFPAFYAASSGLPVDTRVDSPAEAAAIIRAKWEMGLQGAVLVTVPPPADLALPAEEVEAAVEAAMRDASVSGVTGKALTPYLLARVSEITAGRSLEVNIGLLVQNARIAAQIAVQLADQTTQTPS